MIAMEERNKENNQSEYTAIVREEGWGKERYPYPKRGAFIECDEMKCVGCGICAHICPREVLKLENGWRLSSDKKRQHLPIVNF